MGVRSALATRWYSSLTTYHWCVLVVCSLGWLFDTMNMRMFILARGGALGALVPPGDDVDATGRLATTIVILGWATGGILFGVLGDKWGRVKTMAAAVLVYSVFTGLTAFARSPGEFMAFGFCNGVGMGGQFSVAVALLAEAIPERSRSVALGLLQGLSAVGNIFGSLVGYALLPGGWRSMFLVGAAPILLVVIIVSLLEEPESWRRSVAATRRQGGPRLGSYRELLLTNARWRRHALAGGVLAAVGVTGIWGVSFYSPELLSHALAGVDPETLSRQTTIMTICQDLGAFASIIGFPLLSDRIGRKPVFQLACWLGLLSIVFVFGFLSEEQQIVPFGLFLGFGTLALFGGYAVYFPEIFPSRLRATGIAFCYNVGRYLAAPLNVAPNYLQEPLLRLFPNIPTYRTGPIALAAVYIIGMSVMALAPETKGKALPDDGGRHYS
jgi:MFS family permease